VIRTTIELPFEAAKVGGWAKAEAKSAIHLAEFWSVLRRVFLRIAFVNSTPLTLTLSRIQPDYGICCENVNIATFLSCLSSRSPWLLRINSESIGRCQKEGSSAVLQTSFLRLSLSPSSYFHNAEM
jgi:hypothetical protein